MKTAPATYSSNLNDEVKKRETEVMNFIATNDFSNVELVSESVMYDDMLNNNNNNCSKISDKENVIPNICKKNEMNAEKTSLQSSKTFSTDITLSNNNFSRTDIH